MPPSQPKGSKLVAVLWDLKEGWTIDYSAGDANEML